MAEERKEPVKVKPDVVTRLVKEAQLAWALFRDPRVSIWVKLLFVVGPIIYVLSPIDFLPASVCGLIGGLDDATAVYLGLLLLKEFSPKEVVAEIQQRFRGENPGNPAEGEVVEGVFREV